MIDRGSQTTDPAVAKIIRVEISRIVDLVVGDAFNVARAAEGRIDGHSVATSRATRIGESKRFEPVRSREATARACLASAHTRPAIAADAISLSHITRRERIGRDRLIGAAAAGGHAKRNRLCSARISELERKIDRSAAAEGIREKDLEGRRIRAASVHQHIRIGGVAIDHAHTGRRGRELG